MLVGALSGGGAHVAVQTALDGVTWTQAGAQPHGAPKSIHQLVHHLIYWNAGAWTGSTARILRFRARLGSWPGAVGPATNAEWEAALTRFGDLADAPWERHAPPTTCGRRASLSVRRRVGRDAPDPRLAQQATTSAKWCSSGSSWARRRLRGAGSPGRRSADGRRRSSPPARMTSRPESISIAQARRLALAGAGLLAPRRLGLPDGRVFGAHRRGNAATGWSSTSATCRSTRSR